MMFDWQEVSIPYPHEISTLISGKQRVTGGAEDKGFKLHVLKIVKYCFPDW